MNNETVIVFTRDGMGVAPVDLSRSLVVKFLTLLLENGDLPSKILFYTEGVRLACTGSAVLSQLGQLQTAGVELVLCKTCLDYFGLIDRVEVGVVGGMGDILEALTKSGKVITV